MPINTCVQCAQSKVRCDKGAPCGRCVRRGTICTSQARKRGKLPRGDDQQHWDGEEEADEEEEAAAPIQPLAELESGGGEAHSSGQRTEAVADPVEPPAVVGTGFLPLICQWLVQRAAPGETTRVAVLLQCFIQSSLHNKRALDVSLSLCDILRVDGAEIVQWSLSRTRRIGGRREEAYVLDLKSMRLPPFVNALAQLEESPVFLFAYHAGTQTFATNDSW